MDEGFVKTLHPSVNAGTKCGVFFKGKFNLTRTADTFFDMSGYNKGIVWINGHNLGRYWEIGPQKRLYCPASWLKSGENEILVFDLHQTETKTVSGFKTM
jgi:beta-galactosidase GanA